MGINGSDNRLREVQRTLPTAFSNMSIMSTLGIEPPGGCHFPAAGYAEFARLICPLIERDHYGKVTSPTSITPPDLKRAYYASDKRDEIVLEFDQPVKWDDALASQFYLDGEKGKVASGSRVRQRAHAEADRGLDRRDASPTSTASPGARTTCSAARTASPRSRSARCPSPIERTSPDENDMDGGLGDSILIQEGDRRDRSRDGFPHAGGPPQISRAARKRESKP